MTTALVICERARDALLAGQSEPVDRLDAALTDSATTTTFIYDDPAIQRGAVIEVDQELIRVWAADGGSGATIQRGVMGSTAAAHSDEAMVRINPKFPLVSLFDLLSAEVRFLSSPAGGMWQMKSATLTAASHWVVDATEGRSYWDLTAASVTDAVTLYALDGDEQAVRHWDRTRNRLYAYLPVAATQTLHYRADFVVPSSFSSDMTSVSKVPATADELLRLGVQVRALTRRGVKRTFVEGQGDPRRAQEVSESATNTVLRSLLLDYERTRQSEVVRLERAWPRSRRTGR